MCDPCPRRCLACSRSFPVEQHTCYQCQLPLYNTAETAPIQSVELGRIIGILNRRYSQALRQLGEPRLLRPEKHVPSITIRLIHSVIGL